jgi:hypothetical protein
VARGIAAAVIFFDDFWRDDFQIARIVIDRAAKSGFGFGGGGRVTIRDGAGDCVHADECRIRNRSLPEKFGRGFSKCNKISIAFGGWASKMN